MGDGKDRAWDLVEKAAYVGGVDGDAAQRVRGGRNLDPFCLQPLDDVVPARSISKGAVHEDDGRPGSFLRVCAHGFLLSRGPPPLLEGCPRWTEGGCLTMVPSLPEMLWLIHFTSFGIVRPSD